MLIIAVTFNVRAPHREAFLDAVVDNARKSLDLEPGCVTFDVCRNADGSTVFLYERYVDDAAFDLHLKSDHFLDFNARSTPWVASKVVDRYLRVA